MRACKKDVPIESVITRRILRWLNSQPDCYAYKHAAGPFGLVGIPDIVSSICGLALWLEVKRPHHAGPTKIQQKRMADMRAKGARAEVVRSLEEVQAIVAEIRG